MIYLFVVLVAVLVVVLIVVLSPTTAVALQMLKNAEPMADSSIYYYAPGFDRRLSI